MIGQLFRRLRRRVPKNVSQAATVLLLLPRPGAARREADLKATHAMAAGDEDEMWFWYDVRSEIDRRTGHTTRADVATRYIEGE